MQSYFTSNLVDIPSGTKIIKRKKGNLRGKNRRPHATPMAKAQGHHWMFERSCKYTLGKRLFVGDKVVLKVRCSR
jgi:hypothetical protein